ncbi:MAG TPA: Coenzyme F420 hydrogenase/dehydrogenase, beta subunit C-terminal domain [Candidatus Methanofastidiosa archaeon]|nr:Coenzyme F420 hydrogenase/dehydrogenase, beta subunit C-terminal domain [Candidatus Methanofastidiosa archaeon]
MSEELKWFLKDAVVDKGLCTYCGACSSVCPYGIIEFNENGPYIKEECYRNGRGACKDVCHRVMTDAARIGMNVFNFKAKPPTMLGQYEKAVAARAKDSKLQEMGQDGGAVTALLAYMFDNGLIDGAVTVSGISKPNSKTITKKEELLSSQGAKYAAVPLMQALRESEGIKNVAIVSLPCQTYGARRAQYYTGLNVHPREIGKDAESTYIPNISYVIGLFCMENFRYDLLSEVLKDAGVDMDKVEKYSIHMDTMLVRTKDKEYEFSLKDLSDCVWDGCKICRDAVSRVADISAGNIGSSAGWTTILARNAKGLDLIEKAEKAGYIETEDEVDMDLIEDFAGLKMKRFNKELKKRLDTDEGVNFYWGRDYPGVRPEVNGTFFVKVKTKSGLVESGYMAKVAELAEKYGDGTLEVTTRKSIEIQGVKGENLDALMKEIYGSGLMTIGMGYAVACPGMAYCPEGLVRTKELANKITMSFAQRNMPHKMKVGIAGCPNSCVRARAQDIGIMGQRKPKVDLEKCVGCGRCSELCRVNAITIEGKKSKINRDLCIKCGGCIKGCPHEAMVEDQVGYSLWIGGNDARRPTEGYLLKDFCTEEEIMDLMDRINKVFVKYRTQPGKQRLGNIIKEIGIGPFTAELME